MGRRGQSDYLDEIRDWQEHQNTPEAYYPPDRLPFYLRGHGNCLLMALLMFCNAALGAVFAVWFLCLDDSTGTRLAAGGLAILAVLYVLAGLNFLKKHRQRRADALQRRRRHRKRPRR